MGGISTPAGPAEAKVESCFTNCPDPQCGQLSLLQSADRTSNSLSRSQSTQ
jgi:hypothetical protein|tara:strand:+ start:642 stop:794 length:153 start_codon:yes stop_codon:yes gene_type:complete